MRCYRQRLTTKRKLIQKKSANATYAFEDDKPKGKYNNNRVLHDNRWFRSEKEKNRYVELRLQEKIGAISDLQIEVPFELAPSAIVNGRKKPPLRYYADAVYTENGKKIVEDSKGCRTREYITKRHLMKVVHGIDIREV
jgi:hypothetical protein